MAVSTELVVSSDESAVHASLNTRHAGPSLLGSSSELKQAYTQTKRERERERGLDEEDEDELALLLADWLSRGSTRSSLVVIHVVFILHPAPSLEFVRYPPPSALVYCQFHSCLFEGCVGIHCHHTAIFCKKKNNKDLGGSA